MLETGIFTRGRGRADPRSFADGSEFVAEVARWTIRELLDAVVKDFQAPELEAEAGEESADSAESEEHEISRDDGGEAN